MKQFKCENCGARINLNSKENIVCEYCQTHYNINDENIVDEKSIKKLDLENLNKLESYRPKINWLAALVLFCFNAIIGFVYILYMARKQKKWDKKFNTRKKKLK